MARKSKGPLPSGSQSNNDDDAKRPWEEEVITPDRP